jgi:hypothetical protein
MLGPLWSKGSGKNGNEKNHSNKGTEKITRIQNRGIENKELFEMKESPITI